MSYYRWASIAFGVGLGIGSAYTDCSRLFEASPEKLASRKIVETPVPQVKMLICNDY